MSEDTDTDSDDGEDARRMGGGVIATHVPTRLVPPGPAELERLRLPLEDVRRGPVRRVLRRQRQRDHQGTMRATAQLECGHVLVESRQRGSAYKHCTRCGMLGL